MSTARSASTGRAGGVQSIDRVAAILRSFGEHRGELTLSEIARTTGLTTSTVHRLLAAMRDNELVRQSRDRRYAPGPLIVRLGRGSAAVATSLREAALPAMTALRDEVEETVGLHVLTATDERVVVDQVESHHALRRTYTEIGIPIALPYGAPGKVITAFLPEARAEAVLRRPLQRVTPTTVVDLDALRGELDEVRRDGYARSFAERTPGIHTAAAAIFDHTGVVVGCLSVSGPEMRMGAERLRTLGPRVREAGWAVSRMLGASARQGARSDAGRPAEHP